MYPSLKALLAAALLTIPATSTHPQESKSGMVTIFDLGGVFIDTHGMAAFKEVGYGALLSFTVFNLSKLFVIKNHIRYQLVYKFLHTMKPADAHGLATYDSDGIPLPQLMGDWLSGKKTGAALIKEINTALDASDKDPLIKQIIRNTTTMMFTPEIFIRTQILVPEAYELVCHCKNQGDIVAIHSVFDAASFEALRCKYPDFFNLFDKKNIFLSGKTGFLKPDPRSFQAVIEGLGIQENLDRASFVDDVRINIEAAQKLGIHGILCMRTPGSFFARSHPDLDSVQKQLDERRAELKNIEQARYHQMVRNNRFYHQPAL